MDVAEGGVGEDEVLVVFEEGGLPGEVAEAVGW